MKRKNAKFPCKECISFAVCKQKKKIECRILYKYYKKTYLDFTTNNKRLMRIQLYFGKSIWDFYVTTKRELCIEWEEKHHQPGHAMGIHLTTKTY